MASKTTLKTILNDICTDTCSCDNDYCILKEILLSMSPSPRLLLQIKCIEKFKYEESQIESHDIGWQDASEQWVTRGYAAKFNAVYDESMTFKDIYKKVVKS